MKFQKYIHLELININKDKDTNLLFLKTLQYNHGKNTILVPTFLGYSQFGLYIFVVVNLVPDIFNLQSI